MVAYPHHSFTIFNRAGRPFCHKITINISHYLRRNRDAASSSSSGGDGVDGIFGGEESKLLGSRYEAGSLLEKLDFHDFDDE